MKKRPDRPAPGSPDYLAEKHEQIDRQMKRLGDRAEELDDPDKFKALQTVRELESMRKDIELHLRPTAQEMRAAGYVLSPHKKGTPELAKYMEEKGLTYKDLVTDKSGRLWVSPTIN